MASDEIDLYGNIEDDYVETNEISDKLEQSSKYCGLRVSSYVGNLTWWTTDVDIKEAFKTIGVDDIIEIKFHENRQNGQSKGFCVVTFASHHSFDLAKKDLPSTEIHGNNPVVTNFNRANLQYFESLSTKGNTNSQNNGNPNTHHNSFHHPNKTFNNNANTIFNSLRNQQTFPGIRSNAPTLNPAALSLPPPTFSGPGPTGFLPTTSIPPPGLNPLAMNMPLMQSGPTLQLNSIPRPMLDSFGRNPHELKISDSDFDDILQRNKTVASTAIHRAVQDASSGDISNAISTLKTAISLIKQSRISDDDKCKLLINSLNDTLSGIESKSYKSNHKSSRRRRSYSGSDSEDDYRRRSRHRSRSRSRDRNDSRGSRRYRDDRGSSGRVEYFNSSSGSNPSGRNFR